MAGCCKGFKQIVQPIEQGEVNVCKAILNNDDSMEEGISYGGFWREILQLARSS